MFDIFYNCYSSPSIAILAWFKNPDILLNAFIRYFFELKLELCELRVTISIFDVESLRKDCAYWFSYDFVVKS